VLTAQFNVELFSMQRAPSWSFKNFQPVVVAAMIAITTLVPSYYGYKAFTSQEYYDQHKLAAEQRTKEHWATVDKSEVK